MSFDFSGGNLITVIELANKVRNDFVDAPIQFKAISDEVGSLSIIVRDIDINRSDYELNDQQQTQLQEILSSCQNILNELEKAAKKYQELGCKGGSLSTEAKSVWKRLNWEPEDIRELRNQIASNVLLLSTFLERISSLNSQTHPQASSLLNTPGPTLPGQLYASLPLSRDKPSIRLLDLESLPGHGPHDDDDPAPLRGILRVVSLASSPRFAALSYVWGGVPDPSDARNSIRCGTCSLPLTQGCADALRALRRRTAARREVDGTVVTVWVDSVCINQTDAVEKSHQIPLMGDIYQWAAPVFVWLGRATDASDRAFWLMRHMTLRDFPRRSVQTLPWVLPPAWSDRVRRKLEYVWRCVFIDWVDPSLRGLNLYLFRGMMYGTGYAGLQLLLLWRQSWRRNPLPRTQHWEGGAYHSFVNSFADDSRDLLSRPWFRRAWTFQELVLASDPLLLCGGRELSWADFVTALEILAPETFKETLAFGAGTVWLNIPRQTEWNGTRVRRPLESPPSGTGGARHSFGAYLEEATKCQGRRRCHHNTKTIRLFRFLIIIFPVLLASSGFEFLKFIEFFKFKILVEFFVYSGFGLWLYLILLIIGFSLRGVSGTCAPPMIVHTNDSPYRAADVQALIQQLRERDATEPADRSYALYGILHVLGLDMPPIDPSQTLGQVYHLLFASFLRWDASIVSYIVDSGLGQRVRIGADSPSWVPDWSIIALEGWLDSSYAYRTRKSKGAGPGIGRATPQGERLVVRGFLHDMCGFCSPAIAPIGSMDIVPGLGPDTPAGQAIRGLGEWMATARRDIRFDDAYETLSKPIADVLALRDKGDPQKVDDWLAEGPVFYRFYCTFRDASNATTDAARLDAAAAGLANDEGMREYFVKVCQALAGKRTVFVTKEGRIGTGPEAIRTGDHIALVAGVMAPVVLRSTGTGEFTLIGPALIPGLMNGEGWEREGGVEAAQDITLV